jgi:hypothetical protein
MMHTPGPWKLQERCEDLVIESPRMFGTIEVAEVYELDNCPLDEANANARLIAAAPDMWQALRDIAELTVDTIPTNVNDIAVAAIARATGKETP